jgi:hypothetical protein
MTHWPPVMTQFGYFAELRMSCSSFHVLLQIEFDNVVFHSQYFRRQAGRSWAAVPNRDDRRGRFVFLAAGHWIDPSDRWWYCRDGDPVAARNRL